MNNRGALREARRLRLKMQTDGRFHLEVLAALSRTFRENGESVSNDLLRSLVFAVPDELPGRGNASAMVNSTGRPAYVKIPPQPGAARRKGKKKRGKKSARTSIPPQPGAAGRYRAGAGIPPQPGAARRKSKKSGKKSGKKSRKKSAKR